MSYQSSYKVKNFSVEAEREIKRLKAQVELFWANEIMFYRMFGLEDSMEIVECGSGPGFFGQKLLETFPKSRITALEIDPFLVEVSKKNSQLYNLEKYKVIERSILDTGLDDNKYDFAVTRLVLEHLSDPLGAMKEVYRILKPGGKAIFIDNDFEFHLRTYPDIPELKELYNAYCNARKEEGGNPKIGRELPGIMKIAGFSNVDLQILNAHNKVVGDEIFLQSEGSGIPAQLVKDGYLSGEVYSKIVLKWNLLLKDKNHSIYRQLFMVVGEKGSDENLKDQKYNESDQTLSITANKPVIQVKEASANTSNTSEQKIRYLEPQTRTEKKVAEIWQTILEVEKVGVNENFFEAGGSSIQAPEVVAILEEQFSYKLSVVDLFEYPTVALLAKHLEPQKPQSHGKENLTAAQRLAQRQQEILKRRQEIEKLRKPKP